MRPHSRLVLTSRAVAVVAAVCVISTLGLTGPAPAAALPAAIASASGWSMVQAQRVSGSGTFLNTVAVPAPGDVWVAGYQKADLGGVTETRALAERFNGKSFVIVPTPDRETAPAADFLYALSGSSASDLWAVGQSSPLGHDQTLVEHWDGRAWSIVASPNPGTAANFLDGVAAIGPADAWAVGGRQDTGFFSHPMALHWDGTGWHVVRVPGPHGCTGHSYLSAVAAVSTTDVWAVGWCGSGGSTPDQGYVEQWNGLRWAVATGPGTVPANSQLYGVSAAGPHNVWAAGFIQAPGTTPPAGLTLHWDGTTWSQTTVTLPRSDVTFHAIAAGPGHTAWAVGAGASPQPPFAGPLSFRYGQGAWHHLTVPVAFGSLAGLAFDPSGRLWAAGTQLDSHGTDSPLVLTRAAQSVSRR